MSVEFRSKTMPGLAVVADGRRWKFAGGRLIVGPGEAGTIREYAAKHPEYKITESAEAPGQTEAFPEPNMDMTKAELVSLGVARGLDRDSLESQTKAEIIETLGG